MHKNFISENDEISEQDNLSLVLQKERLLSLVEFAQQTTRLKFSPVSDVIQHNAFNRFEHELAGLPGIKIDLENAHDEIWLSIQRLQETAPPESIHQILNNWLDVSSNPDKLPKLKEFFVEDVHNLSLDNNHVISNVEPEKIFLSDHPQEAMIKQYLDEYTNSQWKEWSINEKLRRKTIKVYKELFTLKQQLDGSITDAQIELVWGQGVGVWKTNSKNIKYPLLTQQVEIVLNQIDNSIKIRPKRSVDLMLELDIYTAIDNPAVPNLQNEYENLLETSRIFSPFDRESYETYLQRAATYLDPNGIYWPEYIKEKEDERSVPTISEKLKVTDTWVLFSRPRNKSLFIQDLENFKKKLNNDDNFEITGIISDFINDPLTEHRQLRIPSFRGISTYSYNDYSNNDTVQELFFPLPFNEEQVSIVQRLESVDGVVVQGPPGTGKTHTIANIIAHYMANGKRVLVTSMKEPALSVLKEKLPESIQHLAIALLTNEQEGAKQFEFAISKIGQELQTIDPRALAVELQNLERHIDNLHAQLALIDRSICNWAKNNMEPFQLDGHITLPEKAARMVANTEDELTWFDDNISISEDNKPRFDNEDVVCLREARAYLKGDITYLGKTVPNMEKIPNLSKIIDIHKQILNNKKLETVISLNDIQNIKCKVDNIDNNKALIKVLSELQEINTQIKKQDSPWLLTLTAILRDPHQEKIREGIEGLSSEINNLQLESGNYLVKPVILPDNFTLTEEVTQAIYNKSQGRRAFGLSEKVTKCSLLNKIMSITILNKPAVSMEDWIHVHRYVVFQLKKTEFILKWNGIVDAISIFSRIDKSSQNWFLQKKEEINIYYLVKERLKLQLDAQEKILLMDGAEILNEIFVNDIALSKFIDFLKDNIDYYQSKAAFAEKETIMNDLLIYNGHISESIKFFINDKLGNPSINNETIQTEWEHLMFELRRVSALKPHLDDVEVITTLIHQSGAINWANRLKSEMLETTVDYLLPDNWQNIWKLRRISNYLQSINQFEEFKKLTQQRHKIEKELAKTYQDVVAKRTWLKLTNNATPDIRAALQAFCSAISKIGKGTGKRAMRYRQDAKTSVALTNKTIPCWIMPHYRISESLPADFGCFDLVIIDEASQSDLSALPAILRAKKLLIVGDDKQVSPDGIGIEEEKIKTLMAQFLSNQVPLYRQAISPERSIYDLCKIVFADSQIMLREHFRCVASIIEYSKREFYNHELKPLRLPSRSERLDPPLIDIMVEDGFRHNKINMGEALFIIEEIRKICDDPTMKDKTIGVVSLLGNEQAKKIWDMIQELPTEKIMQHKITCGDALTFQGKERDIMFLSMVVTKDNNKAESRESSAQRFNVAASRARDRMYLVRSVELEDLSHKDHLRRSLIEHFNSPFKQDEVEVKNLRELCESEFEEEIYDILVERGYRVIPQVKVGHFRIDMVVEGHQDARLAIECDGDRYHDASKWEDDMNRQRILERAGWKFWRCFASTFVMNRKEVILDLLETLKSENIEPIGSDIVTYSIHCERRSVNGLVQASIENLEEFEDNSGSLNLAQT